MTQEEADKIRKEVRKLRQQAAGSAHSATAQKNRNDHLIEEAKKLVGKNKALAQEIEKLKAENENLRLQLATTAEHRDKLAGMIFKSNKKPDTTTNTDTSSVSDEPSKRKPGGQKGHAGCSRTSPRHVDEEKHVHLTHCPDCKKKLARTESIVDRVVEDIPNPVPSVVTLYHIERQWCSRCKKEVQAIPQGTLPGVRFGNNLLHTILFLKYRLRTPLAKISEWLKEMHHITMSEGGIQNLLHNLSKRLKDRYLTLTRKVRKNPVKHADETSWRIDGMNAWAWLFATRDTTVYTIEESRGKGVVDRFLGSHPTGVLVSDDYGAYQKLPLKRQSCWAHLLRVGKDAARHPNASEEVKNLYKMLTTLFAILDKAVQTSLHSKERELAQVKGKETISEIIAMAYLERDAKTVQTRVRNQEHNLLTALEYEGVPLTNNHAERQIRPLAVTRKISGGSRSKQGAETHAVLMSLTQTASLRGKSVVKGLSKLFSLPSQRFVLVKGE